jgi:hypothetical protein
VVVLDPGEYVMVRSVARPSVVTVLKPLHSLMFVLLR